MKDEVLDSLLASQMVDWRDLRDLKTESVMVDKKALMMVQAEVASMEYELVDGLVDELVGL